MSDLKPKSPLAVVHLVPMTVAEIITNSRLLRQSNPNVGEQELVINLVKKLDQIIIKGS